MADMSVQAGSTDVSLPIRLFDPATNGPATGLTIGDLDFSYVRPGAAAVKADLTALAGVTDPHADNKAIEIDGTNMPGQYRLDVPDAMAVAGVETVGITINDANGDEIGTAVISLLSASAGNLTQILGTSLTEGAGGRLAAAFKHLLDVATPALVASEAMRGTDDAATAAALAIHDGAIKALAPHGTAMRGTDDAATAAALAATDAVCDAVKAKTDLIGSVGMTVTSAVIDGEDIAIVAGSDYATADDLELSWTVADYAGPSITGATVTLSVMTAANYDGTGTAAEASYAGAAAMVGANAVFTVPLTAAETTALAESAPPDEVCNYAYHLRVTHTTGRVIFDRIGSMTVAKQIPVS